MTSTRFGRMAAYGLFLGASVSAGSIAVAQTPPAIDLPPVRSAIDENGVDMLSRSLIYNVDAISVGSSDSGLTFTRIWTQNGWRHNYVMQTITSGSTTTVIVGGKSYDFSLSGSVYTSLEGDGSTLTATASVYTFTDRGGTIIQFDRVTNAGMYYGRNSALATSVTMPSGEVTTLTYKTASVLRLQSVNSSTGFQLKFGYPTTTSNVISSVTALNNAVDYCNPSADSCSYTQTWPAISISSTTGVGTRTETVTDSLSRQTRYQFFTTGDETGERLTGIKPPASSVDTVTIGYTSYAGFLTSVATANGTWGYASGTGAPGTTTLTRTDPMSNTMVVTKNQTTKYLLSITNGLGKITTYTPDSLGRNTRVTASEGNYTDYVYDSRGNITQTTSVSKTAGTPANIVTSASFDASCANPKKCNKPNSTTDARGKVTDYTYDSTHGGVLTVTLPPATSGGTRPQTRYTYSSLYAWYKNSGGTIVQAASPIYKLTQTSACQTTASCTGTVDETKTVVAYQAGASGVASNLLPASTTASSGTGSVSTSTSTSMVYDSVGNLYTVDGPLSGTSDTTRFRFDVMRQLVGMVGPDPDGAGTLKNRALRNTYNLDGLATLVEQGQVNSQSDPDWANFITLQRLATSYDAMGRKTKDELQSAGGTTQAVTQYSYDAANRPDCMVQRMNPAVFGSLPAACSLGTQGSNGPDRITKNGYDAANQLTSVQTAYLTAVARTDQTLTYTDNGRLQTLKDARNNLTTYEYDGFDRLKKTRYPLPSTPNSSSTTDYEELGYDAGSNVTSLRNRAAETTTLGYDDLNRVTSKNLPGSEPDVSYSYDLFGRRLTANSSVASLSFTYDALGRLTRQTSPQGNTDYQYDDASRRTRLTWPDAYYVTYDYLVTGDVTAIRENGAASGVGVLASFGYDNLGRRTNLTRGNGTVSTYSFDSASLLDCLKQDLAGGSTLDCATPTASGADWLAKLGYAASGQIVSKILPNDAYAFTQNYNANRNYAANGLNQYSAAGNIAPGYDAKGNLTGFWGAGYAYSSENLLTSATGSLSATLSYDPLTRLYQTSGGSAGTTRFGYDAQDMIAEYNSSNALLRRYVHGPGDDEPLVWYEGSGTTDRRWLHADERGSIIAISNGSGGLIASNSYNEYGFPATGNTGRFQYTGQAWMPELGLYYYKARMYSATLGRFVQTDPIGYDDGMNLYAYVGNDPVNGIDPTGLDCNSYNGHDCTVTAPATTKGGGTGGGRTVTVSVRNGDGSGGGGGRSISGGQGGSGSGAEDRASRAADKNHDKPQSKPCSSSPSDGIMGSARAVLETTATGADIATLGFTAGGVTAPIAVATKLVGYGAEAGLLGVNLYDGFANGSWGGMEVQAAGAATRLIPGGRALQSGLNAARGPTGALRNSLGQFRSSYLNNPAVAEAGDLALQNGAQAAAGVVACR